MSTKTSFKRVALVAVAALGLGVLSSVSASATAPLTTVTQFLTGSTATAAQAVVGGSAQVTVTLDSATVTRITVSGVGSISSSSKAGATGGAANESTTSTYLTGTLSWTDSVSNGTIRPTDVVTLYSAVAGVTTVTAVPLAADGSPGTAVSTTVTWVSALTDRVDHTLVGITNSASLGARVDTDATAASLTVPSTATGAAIAGISIMQYSSADTTTVSTLAQTNLKAVTVSIAGAGTVASRTATASARGPSTTIAAASAVNVDAGMYIVDVYADGRTGPGTITISVGGVQVATKTVTFFGTATALATDDTTYASPSKAYIGVGDTATIIVKGIDSLGNTAAALTTAVASATPTTIVNVSANVNGTVTLTGITPGTAVVTVCSTTCTATGALSKTYTVTVTKTTVVGTTMTFDKATYAPGEKMILTVSGTDADGKPIADANANATRTAFTTAPTSNVSIGTLPTTGVAFAGGKATYTLYAPLVSGDIVVSGTDNAAAAVTATATVSGGSADAALDAANEATDAAYAAADAADNATQAAVDAGAAAAMAQESADAALAAVTDLGIKVTGLLDALSKSLANIYKIIKAIQAKQK